MAFRNRESYKGPVKLVILDWAGTTMDYGCYAPAVVFIEVYSRRGVDITMGQARGPMGLHKRDHIKAISSIPEVDVLWKRVHGKPISESDIDDMFAEFQPLQLECLSDYAELIPGTLRAVSDLRERGILIGSAPGYFTEAMELLKKEASRRGYTPDRSVCATQVKAGRTYPWMVFENMVQADVYPPEAVVKVDDTKPGIAEGLNASVWTVGVAKTGNEMGLNLEEVNSLDEKSLTHRLRGARRELKGSGAHYVVDSISDIVTTVDEINVRIAAGDKPQL